MTKKNYYQILNISRNADQKEIKGSFRLLAKKYHPDKSKNGSIEIFEPILKAYKVLSNKSKRERYDAELIISRMGDLPKSTRGTSPVFKKKQKSTLKKYARWEDKDTKFNSLFIIGVYVVLILITVFFLK